MTDFNSVPEILAYLNLQDYIMHLESCSVSDFYNLTDSDLIHLGISMRIHRVQIIQFIKSSIPSQLTYTETETDISQNNSQAVPEFLDISNNSLYCFELRAVSGYLEGLNFKIGDSGASIGRSTNREIVIPDNFVSRKHCIIGYLHDCKQFYLQDTRSTTGTYVMIRGEQKVIIGMMFQVGLSEFKVLNIVYCLNGRPSSIELVQYEGSTSNPIIITKGGVIGRSMKADISVPQDYLMSSEHAAIFIKDGIFFIKDLGSYNKTWIRLSPEGETSEIYQLMQGDLIKIGFIVFLVQKSRTSRNLTQAQACAVCSKSHFEIEIMPCSHRVCMECASSMSHCVLCGVKVADMLICKISV